MPLVLGERKSVPDFLKSWADVVTMIGVELMAQYAGQVGYVTVDERYIDVGETLRRPGLHVDGWHKTEADVTAGGWGGDGGTWGGSGGGSWGGVGRGQGGTGLVTVSNPAGCMVYDQEFDGEPAPEGDCEHLRPQCTVGYLLEANTVYWMAPLCVHESLPAGYAQKRQFLRLSMPSTADWYEGYTENPLGVKPTGAIKPRRRFV